MDTNPTKQALNGWISSLAISVVCCAILFVVFAGYLIDIKDADTVTRVRLETIEQRLNIMTNEVDDVYHRANIQQIQLIPANSQVQVPTSATTTTTSTTSTATPATGSTALPTPASATAVPTPATQPAAVPATAPTAATAPTTAAPAEIPAK
jgi:hypothetical protein